MSILKLRDYQNSAVNNVRKAVAIGRKHVCMVSPTGSGKSLIIAEIIRLAEAKGKTILWLVHRRNLVKQMRQTLLDIGITPGVIMSGEDIDLYQLVQIGTYQTYANRMKKHFVDADILFIDECHRVCSKVYTDIIDSYKDKVVIGCTATPMRADQRPLGDIFNSLVDVAGVKTLTEQGYLAPASYYVPPSNLDLSDVKVTRGDYDTGQLEKKMNQPKLIGDIVQNWLKIAGDRKTIVFCTTVKHSQAICEEFVEQGIPAAHLSAKSTDEEREEVFDRMGANELQVICNVGLYQEGMDCPAISCVVMARGTKSMGLWRQCGGRGLRPKPNGGDCIIIDHGGVVEEHGLLDLEITWTLEGKSKAFKEPKKRELKEPKIVRCSFCDKLFSSLNKCPDCGNPVKSFGKKIDVIEADLKIYEKTSKKKEVSMVDKRRFLGMAKTWVGKQKNSNPNRVYAIYKSKFGVSPGSLLSNTVKIEPDKAFLGLMKHNIIAYRKRMGKKNGLRANKA